MYNYTAKQLNRTEENTSAMKYAIGFIIALAIVYGPMAVLWIN